MATAALAAVPAALALAGRAGGPAPRPADGALARWLVLATLAAAMPEPARPAVRAVIPSAPAAVASPPVNDVTRIPFPLARAAPAGRRAPLSSYR